jgi:hypothetical protein
MTTKNTSNIISLSAYKKAQVLASIDRKMGNNPNLIELAEHIYQKEEQRKQKTWHQPRNEKALRRS